MCEIAYKGEDAVRGNDARRLEQNKLYLKREEVIAFIDGRSYITSDSYKLFFISVRSGLQNDHLCF